MHSLTESRYVLNLTVNANDMLILFRIFACFLTIHVFMNFHALSLLVIYICVRLVSQDSNRRCWGSPNSIGTAWRAAPDAVREFLLATPFGLFMSIIPEHVQRSQRLIAALAERWFDTTHTFHWSWGEMTMTPLDIFVLTGIPASGRPLIGTYLGLIV